MLQQDQAGTGLNVAIIGLGTIADIHRQAILASGSTLCAVCDSNAGRLRGETVPTYTDYRLMLNEQDIDVVHICTPHHLHVPMALTCLEAGKYVLLEKPAAPNEEQLMRLIESDKDGRIGVCLQNRYNATTVRAKQLLSELGDVLGVLALVPWYRSAEYYTQSPWRGSLETEGGCLLVNQAIHTLDLMQHLVDCPISVKAHLDNFTHIGIIEGEDTAMAAFTYPNKATGLFFGTNSFACGAGVQIEITCTGGRLKLEQDSLYINGTLACENEKMDTGKDYYGCAHRTLIHEFYRYVQTGRGNVTTVDDCLAVCKMIDAMYRSSAEQKVCQIK